MNQNSQIFRGRKDRQWIFSRWGQASDRSGKGEIPDCFRSDATSNFLGDLVEEGSGGLELSSFQNVEKDQSLCFGRPFVCDVLATFGRHGEGSG